MGYRGTNKIDHGLTVCMVDTPLVKARVLSFRTCEQTKLYLSYNYISVIALNQR